jgi:GDPmannose 4,6-dehydratase
MKTALICGLSGQDDSYLARLLVGKGYRVVGASRDAQLASFANLRTLGVLDEVELVSMSLNDFRSVLQVLARVAPDEIYNLAGQTSVGLSYEQPVETMESIAVGTLNLLESIRFRKAAVRLYNACSGECFGEAGAPASETTPFRPVSPYAVAKSAAFWEIASYREAYGVFACSGILFNHESPLRPARFVTAKIVEGAKRVARGELDCLTLGDVSVMRDWGWAPEYVDAMWRMLQHDAAEDYVIATGESHSVADFCSAAFDAAGMTIEWKGEGAERHAVDAKSGRIVVRTNPSFMRPSDIRHSVGDATKAKTKLGWSATTKFADVVARMAR